MAYTTEFDARIKAAVTNLWPDCPDWRYAKAQAIAESNLELDARSPVGALGPLQFMPDTWADVARELEFPPGAEPTDPAYAFRAGACYMQDMWDFWSNPARGKLDRLRLAFASYNAGAGNLAKAQRLAGGALEYDRIVRQLSIVTGEQNARQTTDYVARILRIYAELIAT